MGTSHAGWPGLVPSVLGVEMGGSALVFPVHPTLPRGAPPPASSCLAQLGRVGLLPSAGPAPGAGAPAHTAPARSVAPRAARC